MRSLDNLISGLYDIGIFLRIIKNYFFMEQTALRICFTYSEYYDEM